jgi:adenine-specific DNA-methyltransferase
MSELKSIDKARSLLKRLFRTDNSDLDFGIYRIMNFKRNEIDRFIDNDLMAYAEDEFKEFTKVNSVEIEKALEKRKNEINDFVPGSINDDWSVLMNQDLPKVKEFLELRKNHEAASVSEEQVQDVFNHVHEFFTRYYDDGDFISRIRYGGREKYYLPYNGEEVLLHWATKYMYYVKTGEYLSKYNFNVGKYNVIFKLVDAHIVQGNVKDNRKYFVLHYEDPLFVDENFNELEIRFNYRGLNDNEKERFSKRKTQNDLIIDALKIISDDVGSGPFSGILRPHGGEGRSILKKHLEAYVQRNTKDFFIHKGLKNFLLKELEFYLKSEVWDLITLENSSDTQTNLLLAKSKAIRGISNRIIEFLGQIEDFQKRLFEKKKFVLRSDYCITIDLIPKEYYEEIGNNIEQVNEWRKIYSLDILTNNNLYNTTKKKTLSVDFLNKYKYLVVDTKFFSNEFKMKLFNDIKNYRSILNGEVVKSDCLHGLGLLTTFYRNKVGFVYIDPPYNTGNDGFLYKDGYSHSSWLSMIYDRIYLSKELMKEDSLIFISIDDNEQQYLKSILNEIFGEHNFIGQIIWKKKAGGGSDSKYFVNDHEYLMVYSFNIKNINNFFIAMNEDLIKQFKYKDDYFETRGPYKRKNLYQTGIDTDRPNLRYPITCPDGSKLLPPTIWRWSKGRFEQANNEGRIEFIKNKKNTWKIYTKMYMSEGDEEYKVKPRSILLKSGLTRDGNKHLKELFGENQFPYPKPVKLIENMLDVSEQDYVYALDYFAGSGTTVQAVMKYNKENNKNIKYIMIEMGNHFDEIILPRIKKIIFSQNWKDGIPQDLEGVSQIIKYTYLEQYEDTLNNIEFINSGNSIQSRLDRLPDYFLTYMLDYETKDSSTRISFDKFKTPFNYRIKTISGGTEKEEPVDLLETFNYLLGLAVDNIRFFMDDDRLYRVIFGTRENEEVVIIWRDTPDLDLQRDKAFIEKTILSDTKFDTIYINGDSHLENANPIEPEFKRLMRA